MGKLKEIGNVSQSEATVSLAFRVRDCGENLYAAEILMLMGDVVVDSRHGVATTLGHAIGAADDLLDGWAFSAVEQKVEDFFHNVFL